jgi:GrpB-like predicted nucleotidyltransferase (UPF0157 family)
MGGFAMSDTGLERGVVRLAPHSAAWARLFAAEREALRSAVGDLFLDIQHIGSTSVPGLVAKPIVDIAAAVANFEAAAVCVPPLETIGYVYAGENGIPRRHYFDKGVPTTVHLHVLEIDSAEWQKHLLFRDYLIAHPEAADAYGALKQELAERYRYDRPAYTDAKGEFVMNVVRLAREEAAAKG